MLNRYTIATLLLLTSSAALAQGRAGALLDGADTDHDGKVTRQEFLDSRAEQAAKLFERFDTNHDGALDAQEQQAARATARSAAKERFRNRRAQ
jgi:Ca2+-binding EF-hand superfamily protein